MKPKALIVDNEQHRHDKLGADLGADFEVHHAYNEQQAAEAMKKTPYNYVSLDHDLGPGHVSGCHLVDAMKTLPPANRPAITRIHSWNAEHAVEMLNNLRAAGFANVHYRPFQA
jgi:DNA-binding NtrC family response regulator